MCLNSIIKLFKLGNVCVTGLRGSGKDLLFANVIARRKVPYISNLDYTNDLNFQMLDINKLDLGKNTYSNFISGDINFYEFPYKSCSDIYISDCGVYFPSQYNGDLNKKYSYLPGYFALSRQVSHNNVHINVQNLNRCWDKIREQSDIYIRCRWSIVLFKKIVIQMVTIYDKYESCLNRVERCRLTVPFLADKNTKQAAEMYLDNFYNQHGSITNKILIYINKSNYDTFYFEKLLKGGKKNAL